MPATEKILWAEGYHPDINGFIQQAHLAQVQTVAIRTVNDVSSAIPAFHALGIKVLGWRFPPTAPDIVMKEAEHVVSLMGKGLDGYIFDPEAAADSTDPEKDFNWDKASLAGLAEQFCSKIRTAFPNKLFGITSHYKAKENAPHLPWQTFFNHSDKTYPQAYWKTTDKHGNVVPIGHGVAQNYNYSLTAWRNTGATLGKIIPIAGEIALATADEIRTYASTAAANGITELHFYTATNHVPPEVWQAIASA
ncbi:MAG: hypothetical protein QOC96_3595 [Acidobacteriota bacterium]|jgi:hypothetical protein|nr:hypothetical protein [Acidobacteriota bacterium]